MAVGEEARAVGDTAFARRDLTRLIVFTIVAFAALRLAGLVRYPLWTDETWTLNAGSGSLRRMLRVFADDQTHPPFFYVVLWAWRRIGPDTLVWQRLLPCVAGIATAVPLLALAREAGLTRRGVWLAAAIGAGSGVLVAYSAELRSYAFYALFAALSLALWLRARNAGTPRFAGLTVANILLIYSHYFGALIIAAELLDAAFWARRKLRGLLLSCVAVGIAMAPWAWQVIRRQRITGRQLEVVNWIPVPAPGDMLDVVRDAIGGAAWGTADAALVVSAVALMTVFVWRTRREPTAGASRFLAVAIILPVAVVWTLSVAGGRSAWVSRYLMGITPAIVVLLAASLDWVFGARWSRVSATLAMVPGVLTVLSLQRGTAKPRFDLLARGVYAAEGSRAYDAVVFTAVERFPMEAAAKQVDAGIRILEGGPGGAVPTDSGWLVWSERNPPKGLTPPAYLARRGFALGPSLGFKADDDSLVAVRFARRAGP